MDLRSGIGSNGDGMSSARGRGTIRPAYGRLVILAGTCVAMILLALVGSRLADAASLHPAKTGEIDGTNTPAGSFSDLNRLDSNWTSDTTYVLDAGHDVIHAIDSAGNPVTEWGGTGEIDGSGTDAGSLQIGSGWYPDIAVDNSDGATNGRVYFLSELQTRLFALDETGDPVSSFASNGELGGFGDPCGVAVDSEGHPWVADYNADAIFEYDADGTLLSTLPHSPPNNSCEIAFDSKDNLYVVGWEGQVHKYDPIGEQWSPFDSSSNLDVTVGPNDQVYVASGSQHRISAYRPNGQLIERFGEAELTHPLGVTVTGDDELVVADDVDDKLHLFEAEVIPDVSAAQPDPLGPDTATLRGTVDPLGIDAECEFEWGPDASYGQTAPCVTPPGAGTGPVPVSADIAGLLQGTTYHFRLNATNANGTSNSDDGTFTTLEQPEIEGISSRVTSSSATLKAKIHANGIPTTYRFEYGEDQGYGSSAPVPDGSVGSGTSGKNVSLHLSGLEPDSRYHFRVVAQNAGGTTTSSDWVFRTFPPPSDSELPDGRVWERVSPADKNGADLGSPIGFLRLPGLKSDDVLPVTSLVRSSADGSRVAFTSSIGAFADPQSSGLFGQYLSKREETGWATKALDPPFASKGNLLSAPRFVAWNPTLTESVYAQVRDQAKLAEDAPDDVRSFYLRDDAGDYVFAGSDGSRLDVDPLFGGATDDFSHLFFSTDGVYTGPGDLSGGSGLVEAYEIGSGYSQRWASVLPNGTPINGQLGSGVEGPTEGAFSDDGTRVIFSDNPGDNVACEVAVVSEEVFPIGVPQFDSCGNSTNLYVRDGGSTTRLISDYAQGAPVDPSPGTGQHYWAASDDGAKIFFTSQTKLTADSTASSDSGDNFTSGSFGDLYLYDLDANGGAGQLSDITVDATSPEGAQVIGVLGANEAGTRVYFVARSAELDAGHGAAGEANLYVWQDDGSTQTTRFIATLQAPDGTDNTDIGDIANWTGNTYARSSRLTGDGGHLLFTSKNKLTEFDNGGTSQVYLYDADAAELVCASCAGDQPAGGDSFVPHSAAYLSATTTISHDNALSEDGERVFFSSAQRLALDDHNDAIDTYQFDATNGRLSLISAGAGRHDSFFAAADPSGDNALFFTRRQLVSEDVDDNIDLYSARVGGGFSSSEEAVDCKGDACQEKPTSPPDAADPGSPAYDGPGNPAAEKPARDCTRHKKKARRLLKRSARIEARADRAKGKRGKRLDQRARKLKQRATRANRHVIRCEARKGL